jgi:hypothetical protein
LKIWLVDVEPNPISGQSGTTGLHIGEGGRFPELLNDPEYSKLLKKLQSAKDMVDRLELADGDVETLIFQQKRAMLQKFIDPAEDKGIRVYSANKFDLFFYVHLNLFDDLGDE